MTTDDRLEGKAPASFRAALMRRTDGLKVNAPILLDSPVSIECTVVDSIRTGSHEMFAGKVEYVHADAKLVGSDGKIDWKGIEFIRP